MKRCLTLVMLSACALGVSEGFSSDSPTMSHGWVSQTPLILQFGRTADVIVIGRSIGVSKSEGQHYVSVIELERVIASVWDRNEIGRYLDLSDSSPKITILQDAPVSDLTAIFLPYGRHLLWLKWRQLSEAEQRELGCPSTACYTPVKGKGGSRDPLATHGVVRLSRYKEMVGEDEYERLRKILGKDPEWVEDQHRLLDFGASTSDAVVETVSQFSGLMVRGRDNVQEIRQLSQSHDPMRSKIASCLLESGPDMQRFRFATDVEGDAGRQVVSRVVGGMLMETNVQQSAKQFVGASLSIDTAYEQAITVFEAIVVRQGVLVSNVSAVQDFKEMGVMVIKMFKGVRNGIFFVDFSINTQSEKQAEVVPNNGDKVIMFVGKEGAGTSNQVVKVMAHTPENLKAVRAIKDREKKRTKQ